MFTPCAFPETPILQILKSRLNRLHLSYLYWSTKFFLNKVFNNLSVSCQLGPLSIFDIPRPLGIYLVEYTWLVKASYVILWVSVYYLSILCLAPLNTISFRSMLGWSKFRYSRQSLDYICLVPRSIYYIVVLAEIVHCSYHYWYLWISGFIINHNLENERINIGIEGQTSNLSEKLLH